MDQPVLKNKQLPKKALLNGTVQVFATDSVQAWYEYPQRYTSKTNREDITNLSFFQLSDRITHNAKAYVVMFYDRSAYTIVNCCKDSDNIPRFHTICNVAVGSLTQARTIFNRFVRGWLQDSPMVKFLWGHLPYAARHMFDLIESIDCKNPTDRDAYYYEVNGSHYVCVIYKHRRFLVNISDFVSVTGKHIEHPEKDIKVIIKECVRLFRLFLPTEKQYRALLKSCDILGSHIAFQGTDKE